MQTNLVDLRDLVRLNSELSGKFVLGKRIKFNIKKDELDRLIKELNESGAMLTRLRASSKNIHDEITQTKSKRSIRFSLFLSQIRKHTLSLHMALSQGWKSGCHPQHNICLYLDGRTAPLRKAKSPIEFMLALPNPASIKTHQELQEIQVEVMEEEIAGTSRYVNKLMPFQMIVTESTRPQGIHGIVVRPDQKAFPSYQYILIVESISLSMMSTKVLIHRSRC